MKQTKLQKSKNFLIETALKCFIDYIVDTLNDNSMDNWYNGVSEELDALYALYEKVNEVKRTRELNTLVRKYFGEDTADDLIDSLADL